MMWFGNSLGVSDESFRLWSPQSCARWFKENFNLLIHAGRDWRAGRASSSSCTFWFRHLFWLRQRIKAAKVCPSASRSFPAGFVSSLRPYTNGSRDIKTSLIRLTALSRYLFVMNIGSQSTFRNSDVVLEPSCFMTF